MSLETWKIVALVAGVLLLSASFAFSDEAVDSESEDAGDEAADSDLNVEEENDVLILTNDNFDDVINSHDVILVEFYAPWCGHCKNLAPEYEKAAKRLKENDPPVALAKVDATIESDLASRFEVSGYPTLKFFKDGQANDYEGPRQEMGIVDYMIEKADPNWKPPPSEVVVLTSENFDDFINNELSLVEFYAPWCGHCKKLAPEYEKAAQYLKDEIPLGKVDATEEKDLASKYGVTGYPTLLVFRNGKQYEYKGQRNSANDLMTYMNKQKGPATVEQTTLKDLQKAMSKDDITIVGFFDGATDQRFGVYEYFTNNVRDEYKLLHTFDTTSRDQYKVNAGSLVVFNAERFYSKYEPKWHVFDVKEDSTEDEILSFVKSHQTPLVGHMTSSNRPKRYLADTSKPLVIFFCDINWGFEHRVASEQSRQKALKVASANRDDFVFAVTDETDSSDLFKDFGFDDSSEDLNVGILAGGQVKYPMEPMEDGYDEDLIQEFLTSYKKGKLKPKLRSQRPPKKQGAVTVVVGETFDKIVMNKKKDVLIEFYAPWCGHCKNLEPKYVELAKKFKKDKNLVIAKIDATGNDFPEQFDVKGYPTIYFATADHKTDPIRYSGANEVEGLSEFLKENASASFRKAKEEL